MSRFPGEKKLLLKFDWVAFQRELWRLATSFLFESICEQISVMKLAWHWMIDYAWSNIAGWSDSGVWMCIFKKISGSILSGSDPQKSKMRKKELIYLGVE